MTTSKPLFKVFALKNAGALVKGKTYDVLETSYMFGKECYQIQLETTTYFRMLWYEKSFFATQAEWRDKQINSILE